MIKVRAHTCYLGTTGYAAHARNFFRSLSQHVDLRVRNYTWDPNPTYLSDIDRSIIDTITLKNAEGIEEDYDILHSFPGETWVHSINEQFSPDVDIVLMDMDNHYFYETYNAPVKIAYTVWESTELPSNFFLQLLKFDYLWVATEWHKTVAVKQGYPAYRVFVVNEGVDEEFFISNDKPLDKFTYMMFGRWDYRKAIPDILKSFQKAFPNKEKVELVLSADNPFSIDGHKSTEERLIANGITDKRIKVKHFLSREEYVSYIKSGHVLLTCARSEGWNIPLIEAMAAGTPTIYSEWGGQLEFAAGLGNPVKIAQELPASIGADLGYSGNTPGLYAEPDFDDLVRVIRDTYENWAEKKKEAVEESVIIKHGFNWNKISNDAHEHLKTLVGSRDTLKTDEIAIVLSHANTPEKELLLKTCIKSLKKQGYTTVVSTHIDVSQEVKELVDGVILDKDNPVIFPDEYRFLSDTVPIHFLRYPGFTLHYSFDFNHGYAAHKLIKNGVAFADANNFNKTHFVGYDYIIYNPTVIDNHSQLINEGAEMVTYHWGTNDGTVNSSFFSGNTKRLRDAFYKINSKKDYFQWPGKVIFEEVLSEAAKDANLKVHYLDITKIKQHNYLNNIVLATCPEIVTTSGDKSFMYLGCNDDGENFLGIIGNKEEDLQIVITYNNQEFSYSADSSTMKFIRIPNHMLLDGFTADVVGYDIKHLYDSSTKKAELLFIHDQNLIYDINVEEMNQEDLICVSFTDGAMVEIKGNSTDLYKVDFIDRANNSTVHSTTISARHWTKPLRRYYTDWRICVTNLMTNAVREYEFDLNKKLVHIHIDSTSLGDSIAWFPHIEEFRKKHNCTVYVSTFKNDLFRENYPEIIFIEPGQPIPVIYASYSIGWFFTSENEPNYERHPRDFRKQSMQATTTDILGLPHTSLPPVLSVPNLPSPVDGKYVCLGMHSTSQAKYWNNPTGWQEVTDHFLEKGWKVVMLSLEEDGYMGNHYPEGVILPTGDRTLENAMNYLQHSELFIGVSSGLAWLSWAAGTPTTIISGFTWPCTEVLGDHVIRVFKGGGCTGCVNRYRLDPADWNWCPDNKGTAKQFECSRVITGDYVIKQIEDYFEAGRAMPSVEQIVQESYELGMVQNHKEIIKAAEFFKKLDVTNFMEIGTDQGGTFAIWSKLSNDGKRISVDLPHGDFGRTDYRVNDRDEYLKSLGSDVNMFHGSSHDDIAKEYVTTILQGTELDFLFIDGDHTYEGVKQDYEMYKEFVKPGGWIAFHDIKDTEFHRNANCRVDKLWVELSGNKIEFVDNRSSYGGIGFIQVNSINDYK